MPFLLKSAPETAGSPDRLNVESGRRIPAGMADSRTKLWNRLKPAPRGQRGRHHALTGNWRIYRASTAYSSNRGFHVYDAVQNGFAVSYLYEALPPPVQHDESGEVTLQYPPRISGGLQEETFFNFPGG